MHGKSYHFTDGEEKARDAGWADAQTERGKLPHSTLFAPPGKKMWEAVLLCILFNKTVCKCDLNVEQALSWKSLLQLTAKQAKKRLEEGRKL